MTTSRRSYWLILLVLLLGVMQTGVVGRALGLPPALAARVSLNPALEATAGVLWTVAAVVVVVRLIQRRPGAARTAAWLIAGWILYTLLRLLLFVRADYDRERLPFLILLSVVVLLLPVVSIARSRRANH